MDESKLTSKQRSQLQAWKVFYDEESGVVPATIAAMQLGISSSGLYQAGERGWLKFFKVGRDRWYSRKSVARYIEKRQSKANWKHTRAPIPLDCSETGKNSAGDLWFREL